MKRRLLACRTGLLVVLGILVVAFVGFLLIYRQMAPPSDEHLIQMHFDPDFPGFPQVEVLEREVLRDGRDLSIQVGMDGYPERLDCRGWLFYRSGDPYISYVEWEDETCADQFQRIWDARVYLLEYSVGDALPPDADRLAQYLEYWVEAGLISVSDIQNTAMRAKVSELLGKDAP